MLHSAAPSRRDALYCTCPDRLRATRGAETVTKPAAIKHLASVSSEFRCSRSTGDCKGAKLNRSEGSPPWNFITTTSFGRNCRFASSWRIGNQDRTLCNDNKSATSQTPCCQFMAKTLSVDESLLNPDTCSSPISPETVRVHATVQSLASLTTSRNGQVDLITTDDISACPPVDVGLGLSALSFANQRRHGTTASAAFITDNRLWIERPGLRDDALPVRPFCRNSRRKSAAPGYSVRTR